MPRDTAALGTRGTTAGRSYKRQRTAASPAAADEVGLPPSACTFSSRMSDEYMHPPLSLAAAASSDVKAARDDIIMSDDSRANPTDVDAARPCIRRYADVIEAICTHTNDDYYVLPRKVSLVSDEVLHESMRLLQKLEEAAEQQQQKADDTTRPSSTSVTSAISMDNNEAEAKKGPPDSIRVIDLARQVHSTAMALRRLMDHHGAKGGKGRKAIKAAGSILHEPGNVAEVEAMLSSAIATVLIVASLAVGGSDEDDDGNKQEECETHRSIRRAAASGILPDKPVVGDDCEDIASMYSSIAGRATQSLLAIEFNHPGTVDLHIVASLCRAYVSDTSPLESVCAGVVRTALQLPVQNDATVDESTALPQIDKVDAASALGLAAQIGPWNNLRPYLLVAVAVSMHLWHAAERICSSAANNASQSDAEEAVHRLVDSASDQHQYRQADAFATQFYDCGGRSRYAEARLMHAYDTITKVVARRQYPLVERQVERIDSAFARVKDDLEESAAVSEDERQRFDGSGPADVRNFALLRLQEIGEHDAAHRLARIWGWDYSYDEEEAARFAKARRARYLQWGDSEAGAHAPVPALISDPNELLQEFENMEKSHGGSIGFDCEWADENSRGAALLQLSTTKTAILVDIPALTSTEEGCKTLERTVGRLFAGNRPVVGFSCREDVSRLRQSDCVLDTHWFRGNAAVIDIKPLIATHTPSLAQLGLSRVCDHYLGKPLDKAEQCSLWMRRPLSMEQRAYAALDAYACAAIYEKITEDGKGF